jgi:putative membrane protein
MKIKNNPLRFGTVLFVSVVALGISACSLPNAPATKAAAVVSKPFSSGEILNVLQTINAGELKQAQLVFQRPTLAEVQKTASIIIKDHTASNQKIAALAKAENIKLDESPLSRGLQAQMNEIAENLTKASGDEFECMYLQKQVEQHALALDTVRKQLLPAAQHPQVKELLATAVPGLESHHQAAQKSLAGMPECRRG